MRTEGPLLRRMGERHSHKASSATVFHYSCALAQGDWCSRPALTCGLVGCLCDLKVLDPSQVFYDVLAIGIPRIDAVSCASTRCPRSRASWHARIRAPHPARTPH